MKDEEDNNRNLYNPDILVLCGQSKSGVEVDYSAHKFLTIYYPHYADIDLVCGTRPTPDDKNIIMCFAGSFTGELLDEFKHSNIAGNHVSGGIFYKGYPCKRNNGAFVHYNGEFKFLHKDYDSELKAAAASGGMGFAQEMMIHNGKEVPHTRKATSTNQFRALCSLNGRLCIIESKATIAFGDFIKHMLEIGVTEALYTDMGTPWNHSWYRDMKGSTHYIHKDYTTYATNWVVFYSDKAKRNVREAFRNAEIRR